MKKVILIFLFFFSYLSVNAQTGIGTTTPDASAKLEVFATNKGFLPPRVTLNSISDNTTIPSPATGLLVYNTGNNAGLAAGFYYWNGNAWSTIATSGGSGSFASSFLRGSRTATQSVAVGGIVGFTSIDNTSGSDITLNVSDGKITLRPGNTYRLIASVPNFSSGQRPAFMWYNETTTSYVGSSSSTYNPGDNASLAASGGVAHLIITPNVTTVLSFRLLSSLNSGNVTVGGNVDFSLIGSYPWFEAQVISGNAPVTGQSVDYVSVVRTTIQTVNTGDNLLFNTINGGNIPYNSSTGNFSLTAGKTYRLTGSVSLDGSTASSSGIDIAWKTAAGDVLGNRGLTISTSFASTAAGNGVTDIIYTPSINTTVTLSVIAASSNAKTVANYTFANIQQIGSSAIINPWTLSGTSTSNTTGNVGIGTITPGDLLVVGSSIALHDGGDKVVGMGWSPGSGKAVLAGYPAEIRLNPSNGKLSLGTDPTSRSIGSSPGVQRRMTITSAGNIGIGTEDPTEKLEVIGNVKATNFIGTASSASLFLLEANSNANYTLPGPWINDLCRYNNVNNTINVPSSWFNTSTYRFTPQKAGYWEIIANYDVYRNAESYLFIQKNGSSVAQLGAFNLISAMVNKIVYLNGSTDYITVVNQGGAAYARIQNASISWFQARWVGE